MHGVAVKQQFVTKAIKTFVINTVYGTFSPITTSIYNQLKF